MLLWFNNTFPNEFQTFLSQNVSFNFHSDELVTIGIVQELVQKLNQLNETVQQQAGVNDEQAKAIDELRGISLYVRSRSIFQRERERERERERDRETERQTDRQTERQTETETERHREREKETDRQTHKQRDRQTDRKIQISWETYKQIHR